MNTDEYHCNICHDFEGDEDGMVLHFMVKHPREYKSTMKEMDDAE